MRPIGPATENLRSLTIRAGKLRNRSARVGRKPLKDASARMLGQSTSGQLMQEMAYLSLRGEMATHDNMYIPGAYEASGM